jgi:apurinic endonuclease APN1
MKVGYHINKTNLKDSIIEAENNGATAIQLFLSSPKIWATNKLKKEEIQLIKDYQNKNFGNYVVVHGKYLYNFCRPPDEDIHKQIKSLVNELTEADKISSDVVIHQGKNIKELKQTNEIACKNYIDNVTEVIKQTAHLANSPKIILENSARQGTEIGYTLEELAFIFNSFDTDTKTRLGICIDLCHIFVAGSLDMRNKTEVKTFFKQFNEKIGLEHLTVIHFNDSNCKFNGHNDNHQDIFKGYIGAENLGGSTEGFKMVVKYANKYDIPLILETPGEKESYSTQIEYIKSLLPGAQNNRGPK